ncbi:phosphotransferase family protein [Mycolicibacterium elephantis]
MTGHLHPSRLGRWLDDVGAPGEGEIPTLEPLSGGSQNALYRVRRGDCDMVVRMPGADRSDGRITGLLREVRLMRALAGTDVPHAGLIAADETGAACGVPLLVMQAVDGWSPAQSWPWPFESDSEARRGLAFEIVEGAAKLARLPWREIGLADFGRPDDFHDRQVDRWLAYLDGHRVRELPGLDDAAQWLRRNRPRNYVPSIMHGDYQFANVMYRHHRPAELAAIIDWEMTTIGDPLLDLAWALIGWDGERPRDDFYVDVSGMPARSELLAHYESVSGLSTAGFDYYTVLANWKLGIVLERSYAAMVRGEPVSELVAKFATLVPELIATAARLARETGPRSDVAST